MNTFHPDFLGETARRINLKQYPDVRQFVVQHLYPDTLRLLLLLHQHVPIHCVVSIGYSGNEQVIEQLAAAGIKVVTPSYEELATTINHELEQSLRYCQQNDCRLLIHEVGGYAVKSLHEHHLSYLDLVVGAIEVTKQGVWVAEQLLKLEIPQVNCAQTRLKQVEGKMVGEAVVTALDVILRELGYAIVGRQALVLGYGWVGKGTAVSMRQRGAQVFVQDKDVIQCVDAMVDGFVVPDKSGKPSALPAIVIGASGHQSITADLIDQLPDRTFLVSGASKDHEIDLNYLAQQSSEKTSIHKHVEAYTFPDGRVLFLVNKGFPVNFTGASVPDEIVEFLFAELVMLVPMLLEQNLEPGTYPLPVDQERLAAQIWMDLR